MRKTWSHAPRPTRPKREAAEQGVAAERIRLAQDLHDEVSHNVGMIAVQAGAADVTLDEGANATRRAGAAGALNQYRNS